MSDVREKVTEIIAGFPRRFAGKHDDGSEWAWNDAERKADQLLALWNTQIRHCSTCECIHDACGAVIDSPACLLFHGTDR